MNNETPFEKFLNQQNEESWSAALATLLRSIHEVDRNATQIWFAFYPLSLFQALAAAEDREQLAQQLLLQGDYDLKDQIDSSHRFLYGHRFWPQVKQAIETNADSFTENNRAGLADQILAVARGVAQQTKADESLLVGITAVGFMTLRQTGLASFKSAPGAVTVGRKLANKSPEDILRARAKDDSRGLFGFLKTINNEWTITWTKRMPAPDTNCVKVRISHGARQTINRETGELSIRVALKDRFRRMPGCFLRHVLGGCAGRRAETFGRGRARRQEDERVRLHRHG
jgi:hypothetical protein